MLYRLYFVKLVKYMLLSWLVTAIKPSVCSVALSF